MFFQAKIEQEAYGGLRDIKLLQKQNSKFKIQRADLHITLPHVRQYLAPSNGGGAGWFLAGREDLLDMAAWAILIVSRE